MQISCCAFGDSKSRFTFFPGVEPKNLNFKQTQGGDFGGKGEGRGLTREDQKSRNQDSMSQVETATPLEGRKELVSAEGLQTPQPGLAAWLDVPTGGNDDRDR